MGGKLTDKDMDLLEQWIDTGPKTFTLLYAITRDGCNATTFHQKCDNQGPTVTVLYNPQGSVYGGYAPVSWNSSIGNYTNNTTAFLYQLKFNGTHKAVMFTVKQTNYRHAMYNAQNYGPTFGGGNDLVTFTNTVNSSGTYFALNGGMNFGHSYDNQGITANQIHNGNMNVTELEVYKVADGNRQKTITSDESKPWRKTRKWNEEFLNELTEDIVAFKPIPDLKLTETRVLMIGPVGAGKSSFYNTINSVFRGRITQKACSGSAEQSLTTAYTPYKVKVKSGSALNFRLCDTRGLEESQGLDILECNYLLDVQPDISNNSTKIIEKMKGFQDLMNQKGIPQLILLTKIDKLCKDVENDVSLVFSNPVVEQHVEKASQLLGLPRSNVLPVKNYENEDELEENKSILALLTLRKVLHFAEDFLDQMLDRKNDEQSEMEKLKLEN